MSSLSLLLASACVIATIGLPTVSGDGIECYPAPCGANNGALGPFTGDYPGTAPEQLTTWGPIDIPINKFYPQGRTLTKVTIKTKVYFRSQITVTCTGEADACLNAYQGDVSPGVSFSMRLDPASVSQPNLLENYWGRWGDYPDPTELATDLNGDPLFVPYTYPLFDLPGYVRGDPEDPNNLGRWAYYTTDEQGRAAFWFGTVPRGTIVSSGSPFVDPYTEYTQTSTEGADPAVEQLATIFFGAGTGIDTPTGEPVVLPETIYDTYSDPFVKTIDLLADVGATPYPGAVIFGGVNNDITGAQAAAPFIADGPGQVLNWKATAEGFFKANDVGGNAGKAQETSARVAMQVIYEYTGEAQTNGDPQFSGFQGQSFQVHGYPGSYFHLLSAPAFQMNGRFAYLATGHCTYKHTTCWTHPGTYIDDLTFVVNELLVRVTAGPVARGYTVRINDEPFHAMEATNMTDSNGDTAYEFVPTKFYDAATRLTVHLKSPLELLIRNELFSFTITNADHFFNLASQILVRPILLSGRTASARYPHPVTGAPWFPSYPIHGFIGQTWANATYAGKKQYQGDVDDYVETRPYATESRFAQYNHQFPQDMHFD